MPESTLRTVSVLCKRLLTFLLTSYLSLIMNEVRALHEGDRRAW